MRERSLRAAALSRRGLTAAVGVLVVGWLAIGFASAVVQVDAVHAQADQVRAANQALEAELEAGRREIALIQTDSFLAIQSRAFGMGDAGERPFALEPGTAPAVIVPLGSDPEPAAPRTPLEEWLELLLP